MPKGAKPEVPGITKEAFDREKSLRGEFNTKTKGFGGINDAYGRMLASGKNPSAAGDMALIFNYMKMLDPGSTVREGEFATAQNTGGLESKVVALYNSIISGKRLSQTQRDDFMGRAGMLYNTALDSYGKRAETYKGLSGQYQVDPSRVVIDRQMHERYAQPEQQQAKQPPLKTEIPKNPTGRQIISGVNYPVTMVDSRTDPKTGNLISQGNDGNFYEKTAKGWRQIK